MCECMSVCVNSMHTSENNYIDNFIVTLGHFTKLLQRHQCRQRWGSHFMYSTTFVLAHQLRQSCCGIFYQSRGHCRRCSFCCRLRAPIASWRHFLLNFLHVGYMSTTIAVNVQYPALKLLTLDYTLCEFTIIKLKKLTHSPPLQRPIPLRPRLHIPGCHHVGPLS